MSWTRSLDERFTPLGLLVTVALVACGSETPMGEERTTVLGGIVTQQRKTIVLGTNRLYPGQF